MVTFGANRNIVKAIVRAFPVPKGRRGRCGRSDPVKVTDQVVTRRASARERIREGDSARGAMLRSPVRWILVIPLAAIFLRATLGAHGGGSRTGVSTLALVLVLPMLWCAAFARSRSFRIMGGGVMVAVTGSMFLAGVPAAEVVVGQGFALMLLWYAGLRTPR